MRFISLLVICFSSGVFAQNTLSITHLAGDFYVYTTYNSFAGKSFPSNSLYLVTKEGVVMIDTPWDTTQFQPLLDSIERRHHKKVVLCIATHYHDDRTAGLEFLKTKGVKTFTSKKTLTLGKQENATIAEFTFRNDTTFKVGEYEFQTFYPGEGHTPDNIVVWFPQGKVLYGGCFVKSTESPDLGNIADANVKAWEESVKRTMKKFSKADYIIPGHFSWENKNSLNYTLELVKARNATTH